MAGEYWHTSSTERKHCLALMLQYRIYEGAGKHLRALTSEKKLPVDG